MAVIAVSAVSNEYEDLEPFAQEVLMILASPLEKRIYKVGVRKR